MRTGALVVSGAALTFATGTALASQQHIHADAGGRAAFVADCGSGYTRLYRFRMRGSVPAIDEKLRLGKLATALADESGRSSYVKELAALVAKSEASTVQQPSWWPLGGGGDASPALPIILGATGGVREAIDTGKVTAKDVAAFRAALLEEFGPDRRVAFRLLPGEEEAALELSAARFVAGAVIPRLNPGLADPESAAQVGVFSAGGMSAQVAHGQVRRPHAARALLVLPVPAAVRGRGGGARVRVRVPHARARRRGQGSTRERHAQLQRLLSRPFSTRFG